MCSTDVSEAMQIEPWPNDMFAARAPVSPVFPERAEDDHEMAVVSMDNTWIIYG